MNARRQIFATISAEGLHSWPNATGDVAFLSNPQRHLFNIKVSCEAQRDGVELQETELKAALNALVIDLDWGTKSCEAVATSIALTLAIKLKRSVEVDIGTTGNEFGAHVSMPY